MTDKLRFATKEFKHVNGHTLELNVLSGPLVNHVVQKAWNDPSWKRAFLAQPKGDYEIRWAGSLDKFNSPSSAAHLQEVIRSVKLSDFLYPSFSQDDLGQWCIRLVFRDRPFHKSGWAIDLSKPLTLEFALGSKDALARQNLKVWLQGNHASPPNTMPKGFKEDAQDRETQWKLMVQMDKKLRSRLKNDDTALEKYLRGELPAPTPEDYKRLSGTFLKHLVRAAIGQDELERGAVNEKKDTLRKKWKANLEKEQRLIRKAKELSREQVQQVHGYPLDKQTDLVFQDRDYHITFYTAKELKTRNATARHHLLTGQGNKSPTEDEVVAQAKQAHEELVKKFLDPNHNPINLLYRPYFSEWVRYDFIGDPMKIPEIIASVGFDHLKTPTTTTSTTLTTPDPPIWAMLNITNLKQLVSEYHQVFYAGNQHKVDGTPIDMMKCRFGTI